MTPGDLAKAMHDAYAILGYWPDPAVIDGRWEMWGRALSASLLGFHGNVNSEERRPEIHVNSGSAHDRAMAWSAGYSEGFDDRTDALVEAIEALPKHYAPDDSGGEEAWIEWADLRAVLCNPRVTGE